MAIAALKEYFNSCAMIDFCRKWRDIIAFDIKIMKYEYNLKHTENCTRVE